MKPFRCLILTFFALFFIGEQLYSQSYVSKVEAFCSDSLSRFLTNQLPSVTWIDSSGRYFLYRPEKKKGEYEYYIVDTDTWKQTLLFNNEELKEKLFGIGKKKLTTLPRLSAITFPDADNNDINVFRFKISGKKYSYNRKKKSLKEIRPSRDYSQGKGGNKTYYSFGNACYSEDSLYYVSAINHDAYLFSKQEKDSLRLTLDGEPYFSFSGRGNNEKKYLGKTKAIGSWIGGTHSFLMIREDKRNVGTLSVINSLTVPRPSIKTYKFSVPGDKNIVEYDIFVLNADDKSIWKVKQEAAYEDWDIVFSNFERYKCSDKYAYFLRANRVRDTLQLCRLDPVKRELKVLITEECRPHLNQQLFNYRLVNQGKEILWWSERTGKGHYYLYDNTGKLKRVLSNGDFVCGRIYDVDNEKREIILAAYGGEKEENPCYKHYYRLSMDGKYSSPILITPGNGEHSISLSPNKKFVVDSYSRMDKAPVHQICDMQGRVLFKMDSCDVSGLRQKGWKYPKILRLKAADSLTDLYGVVYLPFDLDTSKKYPIISNVYPGPQDDMVPLAFSLDDNYNQTLAQLGFVVINFSYRGSNPFRGRDFYAYGYGNLRDYPLDDDYAVIKQIADLYPFADIERVGIYGHSGGGFMATAAMLTRPDFYKVCIASSGNHDNNIYMRDWGESYHGVRLAPVVGNKNEKANGSEGEKRKTSVNEKVFECKIPTNMELAENLKGKLFLITGECDNNVHPANTMRLVHALIKAQKRFDMMVIPGADHSLGDMYYINLIRYYFTENLLGLAQKNINIVKHK